MSSQEKRGAGLAEVFAGSAGEAGPISTAQRVADRLRAAILSGAIVHGSTLSESEVAAILNVSRNTAREALRHLVSEGLLIHRPHHSPVVTLLSVEDVADVFNVRAVLELASVDFISRLGRAPKTDVMERSIERLQSVAGSSQDRDILEADREFHVALIAAAESPRLVSAYDRLESEIRLCLSISTRSHRSVQELVDQHRRFLELLRTGEYAELKADLSLHMELAAARVVEALRAGRDSDREPS